MTYQSYDKSLHMQSLCTPVLTAETKNFILYTAAKLSCGAYYQLENIFTMDKIK